MTITYIQTDFAGQEGRSPRCGSMTTTNTFDQIIAPGFLNNSPNAKACSYASGDMILASYLDNDGSATSALLTVLIAQNGTITLISSAQAVGNELASVETVATSPASGVCTALFQFKDAGGVDINVVTPYRVYISDINGSMVAAQTSLAIATGIGVLAQVVTGRIGEGTSRADGQLQIALAAAAGTYYLSFVMPNGSISTSAAMVVNA